MGTSGICGFSGAVLTLRFGASEVVAAGFAGPPLGGTALAVGAFGDFGLVDLVAVGFWAVDFGAPDLGAAAFVAAEPPAADLARDFAADGFAAVDFVPADLAAPDFTEFALDAAGFEAADFPAAVPRDGGLSFWFGIWEPPRVSERSEWQGKGRSMCGDQ